MERVRSRLHLRSGFGIICLLLFVMFLASCEGATKKEDPQTKIPPNIVLIFTDDQGYQDLGVFGSPDIETPHLDQMAAEGVQLTSYYAAQAVCSASRAGDTYRLLS